MDGISTIRKVDNLGSVASVLVALMALTNTAMGDIF